MERGDNPYRYIQLLVSRFWLPVIHSGQNVMKPTINYVSVSLFNSSLISQDVLNTM